MRKWYGAFLEACGELDDALSVYESCHEYLAAVRILCRMDSISSAKKLAEKSNDLAACFHLARYFETHGQVHMCPRQDNSKKHKLQVREAVEWFAKAHCIRHAVRLAKQHGMNDELIKLALTAKKELIVEIAQYFEDSGNMDKAASLFFKGGDVSRAVHLCFQTKHYAMLEVIGK
jgi:intraflagellar transport protein 140